MFMEFLLASFEYVYGLSKIHMYRKFSPSKIFIFSDIVMFQPKRLQSKFEEKVRKYTDDATVFKIKQWIGEQR
jgi:hypothetical protein